MKKSGLFLICLMLLSFFACKKSNNYNKVCCGANPEPLMAGLKNATYWVTPITDSINVDSVTVYGKSDSDMLKIKFDYKILGASLAVIKSYTASYYKINKGAIVNSYILDTSVADTLLAQYNKTVTSLYFANSVNGHFILKFKIKTFTAGTDTAAITFKYGTFYSLLNN
jgi:hypothetical protein